MQYRFDVWIGEEKVAIAIHPDRSEALANARRFASNYETEYNFKTEIIEDFGDDSIPSRYTSHELNS